jgi:hypothetical protein
MYALGMVRRNKCILVFGQTSIAFSIFVDSGNTFYGLICSDADPHSSKFFLC